MSSAPENEAHQGMAVFGPLTRTVKDAALIMDVIADGGPSLAAAAATEPGRLRIAISTALPPIGVKPDAEQLGAVDSTAAILRDLGHEVHVRDFDWGMTMGNRILARFMRGIHDTAAEQGHTDRLSRRARGLARIGHAVPERVASAAAGAGRRGRGAAQPRLRARRRRAHADVHPPPAAGARVRRPRRRCARWSG